MTRSHSSSTVRFTVEVTCEHRNLSEHELGIVYSELSSGLQARLIGVPARIVGTWNTGITNIKNDTAVQTIYVVDGEDHNLHLKLTPGQAIDTYTIFGAWVMPWCSTVDEVRGKALQFRNESPNGELLLYAFQDYKSSMPLYCRPFPEGSDPNAWEGGQSIWPWPTSYLTLIYQYFPPRDLVSTLIGRGSGAQGPQGGW